MANRSTKARNPKLVTTEETAQDTPVTETSEAAATMGDSESNSGDKPNTSPGRSMTQRQSLFGLANKDNERLAEKVQTLSEVRQRLAEASDAIREGGERKGEGERIAGEAGKKLYLAQVEGLVTPLETTDILGGIFGFRKKGDAKIMVKAGDKDASKTPYGTGEEIRKRIVRAVSGHRFVTEGEATAFYDGFEPEEIEPLLNKLEGDDGTLWAYHNDTAELKRSKTERLAAAFNPSSIAAITDKLSEPGALERLMESEELQKAYEHLHDTLTILADGIRSLAKGQEMDAVEAAVAEALTVPMAMPEAA